MAIWSARFRVPAFLIVAATLAFLLLGETARAADCRQQVIDDWSDNGRVDRVYGLGCYQDAIEAMPPDIRDYTDAQESIEHALMLALRAKGQRAQTQTQPRSLAAAQPVDTGSSAPIPLPLLVLGALGGTALLTAGFGFVGHRAGVGRKRRGR